MKKIFFYTVLCITLSLASCKKEFLTLVPPSTATSINFYKTTDDIANAVNACYKPLQDNNMYPQAFMLMMEVRSDNVEDQNPGGDAGRAFNVDRFIAGPDNTFFGYSYNTIYNAIARCNNVIAHIDVVTDARLKAQFEGEARFLRALHYFNLVRLWGGVPLVLQPISTEDAQQVGRSTPEAVYTAIEEDLTSAAALLPATYDNANLGRATAGAAKGLLGKVYLTEKKYPQVLSTLRELIPSGTNPYNYTLLPNVADVFSVANKLNAEILFAVHFDKTILNQGHVFTNYVSRPAIDPNLLSAYGPTDTRRDLLNLVKIDVNTDALKKYNDTFDATTKMVGYDFIILRYADVLLMYAEALNEVAYSNDPNSDNFKYLNMVRSRAKASLFTSLNLPDQASFRSAIIQERRLELPFEFSRWFDLIRTNTAIQALQNNGLTKLTIQQFQYLYPIPQGQIEVMHNPAIFPQNPGY